MPYPTKPNFRELTDDLRDFAARKPELGAQRSEPILRQVEAAIRKANAKLHALPIDRKMAAQEPDSLAAIRKLRPKGPRRMSGRFDPKQFPDRLEGALLARCAGCTLGAIV